MPIVQNILGGGGVQQGGQQGNTPNPLSFLFQPPSQPPSQQPSQPPQQPQQQQQGVLPNVNLGAFVNNMATQMGIQDQQQNALDSLIKAAISTLQMSDVLALVNGDWTVLEPSREPLRQHLVEQVLNGDTSQKARTDAIESALEHVRTESRNDNELMDAIRQRVRTSQDVETLLEEGIEVLRTYLTVTMDLVIDGAFETQNRYPNILRIPINHPKPYSAALKHLLILLTGEAIDLMNAHFANPTDSNALTMILARRLLSGLPENFGHLTQMGANMLVGFVNRNYLIYKQENPNKPPTKTKAPSKTTSQSNSNDTILSRSEPRPTSSFSPTPSTGNTETDVKPTTTSPSTVSNSSRIPPQTAQQAPQQQAWYQHLTDTERQLIEETIQEDEPKMRLPPSSVKSEAYAGKKPREVSVS